MTAALRDEAQRLEYRSFSAPSRHRPGQLKPLSRAHRDMFKELSWKARSEGESWWSIKKLGEAIVVGRRQAQNLLYELQAAGLIEIEPRRRGSDRPDRAHTNLVRVQLSGTRVTQNGAHRAKPGSTTRANPGSPGRNAQGRTRVHTNPA